MSKCAFDTRGDMKFALKDDSRVNNGFTTMMQDLRVSVPVAKKIWHRIGSGFVIALETATAF